MKGLGEAAERVSAFLDRYEDGRAGLDPELIHGIDGDTWLKVSDLRLLVAGCPERVAGRAAARRPEHPWMDELDDTPEAAS